MLSPLRELCTWFALDSMGSCSPPKEIGGKGERGTSKDKVNRFLANLEVKNKVEEKCTMLNELKQPPSPPPTPQG